MSTMINVRFDFYENLGCLVMFGIGCNYSCDFLSELPVIGFPFHDQLLYSRQGTYCQISNISGTKFQKLNVSRLALQLPFPNLF